MKKILLLVALSMLVMPLAGQAKIKAFGMNMNLRERVSQTHWDQALNLASNAKIRWAREQFNWDVIEPTNDAYSWATYDAVINKYNDKDIKVLGLITNSSSWASGNPGAVNYYSYPPNPEAWRDYCYNLALHFKGRVDYWEIWNEPNLDSSWQPKADPDQYALYTKYAYDEIKRANPKAKVVIGSTSGTDDAFLSKVFAFYKKNYNKEPFDIVSIHPYRVKDDNFNYTPEESVPGLNSFLTDMRSMRALMKGNKYGKKPIWLTEFGYTTYTNGVYDKTQAQLLGRQYLLALTIPKVNHLFWYDFRDDSNNKDYLESNFGILENDWSKKRSYYAYQAMAQRIYRTDYKGEKMLSRTDVDNFSDPNSWQFENTLNTNGKISAGPGTSLEVEYDFIGKNQNSYAPVYKRIKLNEKTRNLQFQAKGTNSMTLLRVRVEDSSGETFQYSMGRMPSDWLPYRVNLKNYDQNWGGNANGILDRPIYFDSFVIDDNPDGSRDSGSVYFRSLKSSDNAGVYYYKFKKKKPGYVIWKTNGPKKYNLKFNKATTIRVVTPLKTKIIKSDNGVFNLKIGPQPKILQVKKQK
ncbi:beta-galactosidase [Patescibacteria group bacterium]|nr:beta-galactosidase [Patescibacteria group bacterium]MBU1673025.1 beta-galactosidase [Patescibacteria group bacterium]MBU1963294.1 beta-galactosidase [Patescibacteria group bacterium]